MSRGYDLSILKSELYYVKNIILEKNLEENSHKYRVTRIIKVFKRFFTKMLKYFLPSRRQWRN